MSWNLRFCARFANANAGNQTSGQDFDREAYNRRQKRLVAAIIGSSVGLIGSSYGLYRKLTKAKAESPHPAIDSRNSSSENSVDDNEKKIVTKRPTGKKRKGKRDLEKEG